MGSVMDIQSQIVEGPGKSAIIADPAQLKAAICAKVAAKLPDGWKIVASEFFDANHQIGICIARAADDELPLSERRRWASRVELSHPALVDTMIERLSRAWA